LKPPVLSCLEHNQILAAKAARGSFEHEPP
jgi:hypothetical protein